MNGARERRLHLQPESASVAQARAWLRAALVDWPPEASGTAQLLVSELVTNSVLHARTTVEVHLRCDEHLTRVDVVDLSPSLPVIKHFGTEASTGRGMHLLRTLANAWGVEALDPGKRVWFELTDDEHVVEAAVPDLDEWPDLDDDLAPVELAPLPEGRPAPAPSAAPQEGMVTILILSLPTAEYLAAERHNDALIREMALIEEREPGADVPRRLREVAVEFATRFGSAANAARVQVQAAVEAGLATVDLRLAIPHDHGETLGGLAAILHEADAWCAEGDLLTLVSSPRVLRFRTWYTDQVEAQLRGAAPTPWPVGWT